MQLDSLSSGVLILLLSLNNWCVKGQSPPGKPIIISCRSSGDKTFACWWKPDSDGGRRTNYTLLYNPEGEKQSYRCPDYISRGPNSCYFGPNFTSLWKAYNITVWAANDIGRSTSVPHYVDIRALDKLEPPVDLSLTLKRLEGKMYIWAKWSPPPLHVNSSSWEKCHYELRLKPKEENEWETHLVGVQTHFEMTPLSPGTKYTAQVRCVTERGERSEWSHESYVQLHWGQPPGRPEFIKCRSPEKETFTCWWRASPDGGLPINYTLFYNKEREETYYECPDYTTAGPNSCYFDKKHTSLWITYNLTLKATNEMGSNVSLPYYVDVAYIVQPDPPENLSLQFEEKVYGKYLLLTWSPPSQGDIRSGWLTLEYELHIKPESEKEWETISVGQRTTYKTFSINPGERYVAKVRCRADYGLWSNWSAEAHIELQKEFRMKEMLVWIFVAILSFVVCLIMIWTLALKKINMKVCILPPVPGPKIKGVDAQLLEAGKTEELLSALGCQGFPPTPDYEELLVEFLEVDDSEDQQLMPSHEKSHPNKAHTKLTHQEADSDSGRGSCESPSLLPEKHQETRNLLLEGKIPETIEQQKNLATSGTQEAPSVKPEGQSPQCNASGPLASTWPGAQPPSCQTPKCSYHDPMDICKKAFSAMNINRPSVLTKYEEHPKSIGAIRTVKTLQMGETKDLSLNAQNDQGEVWLLPPKQPPFLPAKPVDYVEVHKVHHDGALAVVPKENVSKTQRIPVSKDTSEYTRVSTVVSNQILVVFPDSKEENLASFPELPKENAQNCQPSQEEINLNYCLTAPSACKMQTGGLDYMDPNNFMCRFN